MKQIIKNIWPLLCAAFFLTTGSCSNSKEDSEPIIDPVIWDYSPVVLSLKVLSPEGGSILPYANLMKVSATFRGQTYYCGVEPQETRFYAPHFYGLKVQNDYLLFGELDGTTKFEDEQVVISWGVDSIKADTITFSHWIIEEGKVHNSFCLNGKPIEGQMEIRKELPKGIARNQVTPIALTDYQKACVNPVNTFGMNLFHKMEPTDRESIIVSPLGVAYVLAMIAGGAPEGSKTAEEILKALSGVAEQDGDPAIYALLHRSDFDNLFRTIIERSPTTDPGVDLTVANAFFVRKNFPIYNGYVNFLAETYHADYGQQDFNSLEAIDVINGWCNQKTNGLIPKIINQIESETIAFLINAIYFRAPWLLPFTKESTRNEPFTKADGTQVNLQMMHQEDYFGYTETEDYQALQMPFANGVYTMTFLLPKERISLEQLIAQTNNYLLQKLQQSLANSSTTTNVTLPRFKVNTEHKKLVNQLKALGVRRIFTEDAELSEISPVDILVSNMLQKAYINVNEEGCEAAAVTVASIVTTSDSGPLTPKTFRADHPFLYFITERSTGLIFFAGTYCGD